MENVIKLPMDPVTELIAQLRNAEHAISLHRTMTDMYKARIKELEAEVQRLRDELDEQLHEGLETAQLNPQQRRTA